MKRAFVTGGSGFVGRNLIALLKSRGWLVRALARSDAAEVAVREAGGEVVRGDLDDDKALRAGMTDCEVVFHAAANVEQWGKREDFLRINVAGTERVCLAARASGVSRVVHISTEAVLVGGPHIVNADESWPRATHPIGLYPETKGLAEEKVLEANTGSLSTVIVRPRLIWGKGDTSLLPKIIAAVRAGKFAWIGGGHHLTSTCHVRNVCEGALCAAERGKPGEIYFLTDGKPVELRGFLTHMLAAAGLPEPKREVPKWLARVAATLVEFVWSLFGLSSEPPVTRLATILIGEEVTVNDAKARRELGYVGAVTIESGLAELGASLRSPATSD